MEKLVNLNAPGRKSGCIMRMKQVWIREYIDIPQCWNYNLL